MGPWCAQMGASGWITMIAMWAALIGLVVWAVTRLFPTGGPAADPRALLDERLARGDIDADTYRSLRHELDEPRTAPARGTR